MSSPDKPILNPQPFSVLVLSISRKVPLLQAVRRAMDRVFAGGRLWGADLDGACIGRHFVDEFREMPPLNDLGVAGLVDFCVGHEIRSILPTRDGELPFLAHHRQALAAEGIEVLVSPEETIAVCDDKLQFAEHLRDFSAIPTALSLSELCGGLFVVKERRGAGARSMGLRLERAQAIEHAARLSEPIFQPYIAGREFSIDLYRSMRGRIEGIVARSRDLVRDGESQITTTLRHPCLEKLCCRAAQSLDIQGHAVFQALEDAQGRLHLIECNPRFGGASTLSLAAGLESFAWFFLEALGHDPQKLLFARTAGELRQVRYAQDLILPV